MPSDDITDFGIISMPEFLEFLKLTLQLNESITGGTNNSNSIPIDYNQLSKNVLVNNLLLKNPQFMTAKTSEINENDNELNDLTNLMVAKDKAGDKYGRKRSVQNGKSQKLKSDNTAEPQTLLNPALSEKLSEFIDEGILDSVLPFICPINSNAEILHINQNNNLNKSVKTGNQNGRIQAQQIFDFKPPQQSSASSGSGLGETNHNMEGSSLRINPKQSNNGNNIHDGTNNLSLPQSRSRRKSISPMNMDNRNDNEVVIHVCDEVKGASRDFTCPQKLLVSKMGYFADVTMGSKQKLEDMDISVHCDLQIFEWLMKWVKRESLSSDDIPSLDPSNVVPILVSASFLQMEPLLIDCLSFCHSRLNDVVKASANLSCLNDGIVTRLAAMFTNLELELVKDKKDRVVPRLWTKMIQSLCEPETQSLRGHFASLAGLFKCNRCGKFLTSAVSTYIYCLPQNMRINRWGQVISQHTRDTNWNITNYVSTIYKELKSWRKVYWKLWGHCHFLYCSVCETHFPVYQMLWCQYHPDQAQFLGPVSEGRTAGPGGRYPCCNQQAFRYETLTIPNGCISREHTVQIDNDRDRAIYQLVQVAGEGGCLFEMPTAKTTPSNGEPWWSGIAILPYRSRQGLLPTIHIDENCGKNGKIKMNHRPNSVLYESSSDTDSSGDKAAPTPKRYSSSSDGGESDEDRPTRYRHKRNKRRIKLSCGRYWSGEMSARSNQDNQREFEERAMKQVIAMVEKRTGSDVNIQYQNYSNGGSYMKLESEWRENLKQRNSKTKIQNNGK